MDPGKRPRIATGRRRCQSASIMTAHTATTPEPLSLAASGPLSGTVTIPGDKSISHRALMFGALAVGETVIDGLLEGEDVLATAAAMRAMGATIEARGEPLARPWRRRRRAAAAADGARHGQFRHLDPAADGAGGQPPDHRDLHRRRLAVRRPMGRVIEPLSLMGASFCRQPGGRLPLTMRGLCPAVPLTYTLPVASAQVKIGHPAGRAQHPGRNPCDRADPHPRSQRAHAGRLRRRPDGRVEQRQAASSACAARQSSAAGHRRARRSLVGGLSAGCRVDRAGQRK